jgi:hypothetical protein
MPAKIELVLDDEVKKALDDLIPSGEHSRFANEALRAQLVLLRRQRAIDQVEALRRIGAHVSTSEILLTLRSARDSDEP